jgi:nicotinamide mononucleotide transporter
MNPYEVAGVVFGVLAVWLTVRESLWCWPTGLLYVVAFVVVFHQARLYANMGLQVVYGVLCVYGWYQWLHGGKDRGALAVSRTPRRALAGLLAAGVGATALLMRTLGRATDAALPFWDASTTSFSLVAQAMVTRKWIENWIVWIVVDTAYVGMYLHQGLYATAGLYGVFLVLAVMGLREWGRTISAGAPA